MSGAIKEGRNMTTQSPYLPLASGSHPLAGSVRALARDSEFVVSPGSKLSSGAQILQEHSYTVNRSTIMVAGNNQ